jgi:hypothetical protein
VQHFIGTPISLKKSSMSAAGSYMASFTHRRRAQRSHISSHFHPAINFAIAF